MTGKGKLCIHAGMNIHVRIIVVMFGGSYSGRGCMRGDTGGPAPIKALRRAIARQRIEVVVDEFRSTITHSTCGTDPRP
jgi:hypothetical protein